MPSQDRERALIRTIMVIHKSPADFREMLEARLPLVRFISIDELGTVDRDLRSSRLAKKRRPLWNDAHYETLLIYRAV
jgi:hypothetical protein